MSVVRRQGIKNTVYTYLGVILGVLSTLYIQPFFLTQEQVGITRLVISVGSVLASFSCLGVTGVIIKFFPVFRDSEKKHHGFFTLALVFPLTGFLLVALLVFLFNDSVLAFYGESAAVVKKYQLPILLIALFNCFIFSFNAYCNAIQRSSFPTFVNEVLNRLGFIASILLFFYGMLDQNEYIYSVSFIFLIQSAILFFVISRFDHPRVDLSFFSNNRHLGEIIRFGAISTFIQVTAICLKFVDVLFVGRYEKMDQVGVYSIAAFIGIVLETPLTAIEKIAGPKIAQLFAAGNQAEILKMYQLSSRYLMVFCGFLGCLIISCVEPALALLPGDYSSGALVTVIICIGTFFNAATGINYSILTYSNQYKLGAVFYIFLLTIACVLNIYLIPRYGITGAAIAAATIAVLHNIMRFLIIYLKLNMQPFRIESLKIVLIIFISVAAAYLINVENKFLLIALRGAVSGTLFLLFTVLLKVFTIKQLREELLSLKKTFF